MPISRLPHGMLATPNIGGTRLVDIWNSDNVFFVDGVNGSNDHDGMTPDSVVASISQAVLNAKMGASVYIKPKSYNATGAQSYYSENIVIPVNKPHISIVGAGADNDNPYNGVDIRAAQTTAGVLLDVCAIYSVGCIIDGVRMTGGGQTANVAAIVRAYNDGSTATQKASAFHIKNSRFAQAKGTSQSAGAAIQVDTGLFSKISNCHFTDNPISISLRTVGAMIQNFVIQDCIFSGLPATRWGDIQMVGEGKQLLITRCNWTEQIPSGGSPNLDIYIHNGFSPTGLISDCNFGIDDVATSKDAIKAGGTAVGSVPATILVVNCRVETSQEGYSVISRA